MSGRPRKTCMRLADGRELIYFDSPGAPARTARDTRPLPPHAPTPAMRYDAGVDEWVAVASQRQDRTFLPPADECPLCPTRPGGHPSEIPEASYEVVVFANRFPSFAGPPDPARAPAAGPAADPAALPGLAREPVGAPGRRAAGRCEVVCFTDDHGSSFGALSPARARLVLDALADRTAALSALPGVEQVFCFENRGEAIGVTLHHPHGQVYAYPFVPPRTRAMLRAACAHREATGGRLGEALLARELADGARVVAAGRQWVAYVPFAARWPVEVHLRSRTPVPDLAALDGEGRDDLAAVYLDLLGRLDRFYGRPLPFVAAWHQAPVHTGRDLLDLHLELFSVQRSADRLKYLAGSESAMDVFVNDRDPEEVAARLRSLGGAR